MVKYKCVAAVNEGKAVRIDNDPSTKYALIASPGRLYGANFLLSSYAAKPTYNIKNDGLSVKAVQLYQDFFRVKQSDLYLSKMKPNSYSSIWSKSFIYSPYIMRNSHQFKQYFNRILGQSSGIIENLRN